MCPWRSLQVTASLFHPSWNDNALWLEPTISAVDLWSCPNAKLPGIENNWVILTLSYPLLFVIHLSEYFDSFFATIPKYVACTQEPSPLWTSRHDDGIPVCTDFLKRFPFERIQKCFLAQLGDPNARWQLLLNINLTTSIMKARKCGWLQHRNETCHTSLPVCFLHHSCRPNPLVNCSNFFTGPGPGWLGFFLRVWPSLCAISANLISSVACVERFIGTEELQVCLVIPTLTHWPNFGTVSVQPSVSKEMTLT